MRRYPVRFSESEASNHTPSLADFTTTTPELKFSVHTGSIENRARLLFEVLDAVSEVWPVDRIGVRISPFSDVGDSDPAKLYAFVIEGLDDRGICYLHLIEARARAGLVDQTNDAAPQSVTTLFRPLFPGPMIVSGGFTVEKKPSSTGRRTS